MESPDESPRIVGVVSAFPRNYYSQTELTGMLERIWPDGAVDRKRLEKFHQNIGIQGRYLALPIEEYLTLEGFAASNDAWMRIALDLGEELLNRIFERFQVTPDQIGELITTSVTGIAVPSIDARLMNRIPFSKKMKRVPLFGLGCLGGAAGIARAADYLRGHPDELAVLLSVELCSLTLQRDDFTAANLVSSGLFGDGAAAVLLAGARHPLAAKSPLEISDNQSVFLTDTEGLMGYEIRNSGFKMLLGPNVNQVIQASLRSEVEEFLREHRLGIQDIGFWAVHPGGPKIIDAVESALGLAHDCLQGSRDNLARYGNVSSASVLLILEETLKSFPQAARTNGLLMAMGPGFSVEMVLLK